MSTDLKTVRASAPPAEGDEAIDVGTAAELAGVTPKTIRSRIHKGLLPAVTHLGQMWVSRLDVEREFTLQPYLPKNAAAPALSAESTPERWDRLKVLLGGASA